ncbi:hypothetical protein INT47_004034 [Mucor saturninus]|uniref:MADF domain-containing protein n=1 Tax=Mucor saturninus TaxID=64648 RepID=A0A8H7QGI1_9FUNG|nr:hypothetical protein INT47_004034 [Mucor saturninus]
MFLHIAYRNLQKEYNEKAQHANVPPRELEPIKSKWNSLVENYKKEVTRRSTTGESGSAADQIYDKLDGILQNYLTIRPPCTYSSQTRRFTDNTTQPPVPVPTAEAYPLPSSSSSHPSSSTFEHVRPSMSEDLEPPTSRRRTVPPQSYPPRQTSPLYQPPSPSFHCQPPPSFQQPSPASSPQQEPTPHPRQEPTHRPPQESTTRPRQPPNQPVPPRLRQANLTPEQLGWEAVQNRVSCGDLARL